MKPLDNDLAVMISESYILLIVLKISEIFKIVDLGLDSFVIRLKILHFRINLQGYEK